MEHLRLCRRCKAQLHPEAEHCLICGEVKSLPSGWYTWPIGLVIFLALAWLLIDFNDVAALLRGMQ